MADQRKTKRVICRFDLPIAEDRERTRIIEDHGGLWRIQSLSLMSNGKRGWRDEFRIDNYPCETPPNMIVNLDAVLRAAYEEGQKNASE